MTLSNVIKPTHLCNLACTYCYNDDVRRPVMSVETLERTIAQTFELAHERSPTTRVDFIWHGGEPMIAGKQYYRAAVELQRRYCGASRYTNAIQTNGTLIDDEWLRLFRDEGFGVSISVDGPGHIHDMLRQDRRGRGSFERVREAIARVRGAGLPFGVCAVISKANVARAVEIYDFFARERLPFNPIPLNRSGAARENFSDLGLEPDEYADAWIPMYDRWFDAEGDDYVYCSDFVHKTRAIMRGRPMDCVALEQCSQANISVDPIGDVYPCASLSGTRQTCYGNLMEASLMEIMRSPLAVTYQERRVDPQCSRCKWQHVCHGGCQARSYKFFGDNNRRDYYCPSLFRMYEHVERRLREHVGDIRFPRPEKRTTTMRQPRVIALGTARANGG